MKKLIFIFAFFLCFMGGYAQNEFAKWRINLSGGIGYDVENTSEDEKQMTDLGFNPKKVNSLVDDLKLGGQGNADVHYLLNKNFGIGLKYIFFQNDGKIEEIKHLPLASGYGAVAVGAKEKDIIHYVGPSLHLRSDLGDSRFAVSATLSGGYTHYTSDTKVYQASATNYIIGEDPQFIYNPSNPQYSETIFNISGGTFGLSAGVGLEYFITNQIALGVDIGYFYSSLNDITIKNYLGQKISLKELNNGKDVVISRLDFSLGIKLYL
jgi:opacity protein-like surface antigen